MYFKAHYNNYVNYTEESQLLILSTYVICMQSYVTTHDVLVQICFAEFLRKSASIQFILLFLSKYMLPLPFTESSIVRRLSFKSEYDVSCDKISNANSRNLLNVVLSHRRDQLQSICSQSRCTV